MAPYYYSPLLSSSHIRVIKIAHDDTSPDAPLRCTIHQIELSEEDPPVYSALSYTWGSNADTQPLLCANEGRPDAVRELRITTNLAEALRVVIEKGPSQNVSTAWDWEDKEKRVQEIEEPPKEQDFYLWVDQICINQGDDDERAAQVGMMDLIYRRMSSIL